MSANLVIREATIQDLEEIRLIYNQGIEDRIATLEETPKSKEDIQKWYEEHHQGRYAVLVIESDQQMLGWASLNAYSHRYAYQGVADLSIYIERSWRGKGLGSHLLKALENKAKENRFHKIILSTFLSNSLGQGLYRKRGFREVGVFENQGIVDGQFIDVMTMEKWLGLNSG
ncbi:phosphinothricin acetyltransferase [Croceifilum oryzae]|uniref:Phosphinothricin acetyltransferase n=1 Tax=Croceifilum oryzae TaxID=1553429 RepID=A0AAJ1TIL8_9BACL|nr:arsinothricin resistance N-acetyltransferase ArsN1 family A [Croceifilum oryzae]MDQ0416674.1 phosphinothricin acetyltransferase [Croceifilum oryzae]